METAVASRNLALDAAFDVLDGGGHLRFYDGVKPTNIATAITTQNRLANNALSSNAFADASGGSKAAAAISNATIEATATATWATMVKPDGVTRVADLTVGVTSSGMDIELDAVALVANATLVVSSLVLSQAAS